MDKGDIAGVGFFVFFLLLNVTYEYIHTVEENWLVVIILIFSHIGYIYCIKNIKWVDKNEKRKFN